MTLAIVTATTNPRRAMDCIASWEALSTEAMRVLIVVNGIPWTPEDAEATGLQASWYSVPTYLGSVAAFQVGVNQLLASPSPPEIIACLHDDFLISEPGWATKVRRHFDRHSGCGLLGFGGATGLGSDRLYVTPYDPMQLARVGFRSNLEDAEQHGLRSVLPERVACLDGFSQVGRREFWEGHCGSLERASRLDETPRPWDYLVNLGMRHHFYDGALGCLAARYGWETWYLPLRGHHFGGRTAVGDEGYATWARQQTAEGDQDFWHEAHKIGYDAFRDVLPLRV